MNLKYVNISQIYREMNSLFQDENKWNEVTAEELKYFICINLRLIINHAQNVLDAQDSQEKLLKLSHKINEKFISHYAHNLAFEIMGIAQGIFSKEVDKNDYTSLLPKEIRQKIYEELIFSRWDSVQQFEVVSGLESVRLISKIESKVAEETKISWINNKNVSLKSFGCKTIQAAIQYIKNNQNLYNANLLEFKELTNENLKELQDCTWIQHLIIDSDKITDDGLKFLKGIPLKSIDCSSCDQLTDKALEHLKEMPLQSVNFSCCPLLTDKAFEYLKKMPLQSFNFSNCYLLTDKSLEYLKGIPLQSINFSCCPLLTDKALEYLKEMPLKNLNFRGCHQLTDRALDYLKEMPLKSVNFIQCHQLTDKALEYLEKMTLDNIKFSHCPLLTDKALEYLKEMPLKSVQFSFCPLLTNKALEYLKEMPLQSLSLTGCNQLTAEALKNLRQHFRSIGRPLSFCAY